MTEITSVDVRLVDCRMVHSYPIRLFSLFLIFQSKSPWICQLTASHYKTNSIFNLFQQQQKMLSNFLPFAIVIDKAIVRVRSVAHDCSLITDFVHMNFPF